MNKLKQKKLEIIKKVAQFIADSLVESLRMAKTNHERESIIFYGLLLDNYMIETHNIYLD